MSGAVTTLILALVRARHAATLSFVLLAAAASAQSQPFEGRVVDPQGAAISGARITLSDAAGAASKSALTGSDGTFVVPNLAAGSYRLQIEAPGFQRSTQTVTAGATAARLDITLQIAALSEDVSVVGSTPITLTRPAGTGSRLGLTPLETPASVQVLTGEVIRDRGDVSVADAKTRAVGVTAQATPGNGGGGVIARGFAGVGSVMQIYDGTQFFVASGTITFPFDPWTVDRIEVLGGPGSVLYGNGAIGGVVNVVPRKPNPYGFENNARVAFGSNNTWRAAIDSAGPISTKTSYRFDLSHNRSDGWVDRGDSQSTALTAALRHQFTQAFSVTVSEDFGHQEPQPYFGVPTINGVVDRSRRDDNYNVDDGHIDYKDSWTQVKAEWQPFAGLRLRNTVQYLKSDRHWRDVETYTFQPATQLVQRSSYIEINHQQTQYGDHADLVLLGRLFGKSNSLSSGVEFNHIDFEHINNSPYGGTSAVGVGNATPGSFINLATTFPRFQSDSNQAALFVEDRLVLGNRVSLVGGGRVDRHHVERLDLVTQATNDRTFTPVSGRGGVVFSATPGLSLYGQFSSATDAIGNVITQSAAQQLFDLATGQQFEAGAKQALWGGRAEWTFAGYRIVKKKLLAPDPLNPAVSQQIGQQSSRGVEITAAVTAGPVRIDGNAALLGARFDDFAESVLGTLISRVGNRPPSVPTRSANLWLSWNPARKWQARGGVRYVGARYWNNANTSQVPGFAVLDLGGRRTLTDKLAVDLRVYNLGNTLYATTFGGNGTAPQWLLGAPRTAELAITVRF